MHFCLANRITDLLLVIQNNIYFSSMAHEGKNPWSVWRQSTAFVSSYVYPGLWCRTGSDWPHDGLLLSESE